MEDVSLDTLPKTVPVGLPGQAVKESTHPWDSLVSFRPGIPVQLGGTLELTFANDVNVTTQVGRSLPNFDWTGVTLSGTFGVESPYVWDLARLYTTGEVTLTAVPEPKIFVNFLCGLCVLSRFAPPSPQD